MTSLPSSKPDNVAAVLKVFAVLETLAHERRAGLADIAQRAVTSKSTTYRLLQTMVDLGYVEQEADSEKYGLTLKLFGLGVRALSGHADLIRVADRAMGVLSRATHESINLGVMDEREQRVAYVHKYDSAYDLSMQSPLGKRKPLHSTALGKALLAWRDPDEIRERLSRIDFVKLAPHTITDPEVLMEQLRRTREQGYAEENEESEAGVRCMAVPVFDHLGKPVAAISISFPLFRFDETRKPDYVDMLKRAGREVSQALGFLGEADRAPA
jgi:IclR family transcriptional regulator, KDG regulon repressor